MLVEDQRFIHEDLERLEQGISDRISEEPRNVRAGEWSLILATRILISEHRFAND